MAKILFPLLANGHGGLKNPVSVIFLFFYRRCRHRTRQRPPATFSSMPASPLTTTFSIYRYIQFDVSISAQDDLQNIQVYTVRGQYLTHDDLLNIHLYRYKDMA